MNVERMNAVLTALQDELKSDNIPGIFQNLVDSLQNVVNAPQQSQYQQEVSNHLKNLTEKLTKANSNEFSPVWRNLIEELDFDNYLGYKLKENISEIFSRNQITPATALKELKELLNELKNRNDAINQILSGFNKLDIKQDILNPGECEIGVLIPRVAIKNSLSALTKELNEIDIIFGGFEEMVTSKRDGIQLRTISSSDPSFFFDTLPAVAAFSALAIERILALYKNLLEIRKLHLELKEKGLSKKDLSGIERHANELIKKGIEELLPELLEKFSKDIEKQRKNELLNSLRISLNKIANRIDKGFNYEIKAEPFEENEDATESNENTEDRNENINIVLERTEALQFIKSSGGPILSLPEGVEK